MRNIYISLRPCTVAPSHNIEAACCYGRDHWNALILGLGTTVYGLKLHLYQNQQNKGPVSSVCKWHIYLDRDTCMLICSFTYLVFSNIRCTLVLWDQLPSCRISLWKTNFSLSYNSSQFSNLLVKFMWVNKKHVPVITAIVLYQSVAQGCSSNSVDSNLIL